MLRSTLAVIAVIGSVTGAGAQKAPYPAWIVVAVSYKDGLVGTDEKGGTPVLTRAGGAEFNESVNNAFSRCTGYLMNKRINNRVVYYNGYYPSKAMAIRELASIKPCAPGAFVIRENGQ